MTFILLLKSPTWSHRRTEGNARRGELGKREGINEIEVRRRRPKGEQEGKGRRGGSALLCLLGRAFEWKNRKGGGRKRISRRKTATRKNSHFPEEESLSWGLSGRDLGARKDASHAKQAGMLGEKK